jgi:hypothetical protein
VITQHNRGTSEYPPRVRGELTPRYRRRDDGQRIQGIGTIRRVGHEIGALSAPLSGSETADVAGSIRPVTGRRIRGARGERYPPCYRRCKSAPVSVSVYAPLSPGKSRQIAESTIRPVTDGAGAPLPHQRPQFRSRSGRLHPHQATASTVTLGLEREHRGEFQPRAGLRCVWGTRPAMAPLTGQLRPHWRGVANIGTARNRVEDYARPATLTNTIGTGHGRIRPQWRSVKSLGNTVKSHKHRSRETTPSLPNWAVPLTETCRDLPRTSTARNLARGIGGLKIYRSASV